MCYPLELHLFGSVLLCCDSLLLAVLLQGPVKSLQFESTAEELDFEFDDAPDTGGRRPNFSEPPTW